MIFPFVKPPPIIQVPVTISNQGINNEHIPKMLFERLFLRISNFRYMIDSVHDILNIADPVISRFTVRIHTGKFAELHKFVPVGTKIFASDNNFWLFVNSCGEK